MAQKDFGYNIFKLHKSGALIWPKNSTLIIADLHLGKSSYFAKQGTYVPPYDNIETLNKIIFLQKETKIKKLLLLGDLFHDNRGLIRLEEKSRNLFYKILKGLEVTFIRGNHDNKIEIPYLKTFNEIIIDNINFSHETTNNDCFEVCGHYHPKFYLNFNGKKISKKCFIVSKKKIILPAFGYYTGGLDIKNKIFKTFIKNPCNYYLIGEKGIYHLIN